jgi:hypothetical protein
MLVSIERHIYNYRSSSNHISQCSDIIPAKISKQGNGRYLEVCQMNFKFGKLSQGICCNTSCKLEFGQGILNRLKALNVYANSKPISKLCVVGDIFTGTV